MSTTTRTRYTRCPPGRSTRDWRTSRPGTSGRTCSGVSATRRTSATSKPRKRACFRACSVILTVGSGMTALVLPGRIVQGPCSNWVFASGVSIEVGPTGAFASVKTEGEIRLRLRRDPTCHLSALSLACERRRRLWTPHRVRDSTAGDQGPRIVRDRPHVGQDRPASLKIRLWCACCRGK